MIDQYQAIFQQEIDKTSAQINFRMEGKLLYEQIGLCLEIYENLKHDKDLKKTSLTEE